MLLMCVSFCGHAFPVATSTDTVISAFRIVLCAGWVYRDISVGNTPAIKTNNTLKIKLADLEYAKRFPLNEGGPDPKTVSPSSNVSYL